MTQVGKHFHPEYRTQSDANRSEDRTSQDIHELSLEVRALSARISWLVGAVGVLVFIINLVAPLLTRWIGLPT